MSHDAEYNWSDATLQFNYVFLDEHLNETCKTNKLSFCQACPEGLANGEYTLIYAALIRSRAGTACLIDRLVKKLKSYTQRGVTHNSKSIRLINAD